MITSGVMITFIICVTAISITWLIIRSDNDLNKSKLILRNIETIVETFYDDRTEYDSDNECRVFKEDINLSELMQFIKSIRRIII